MASVASEAPNASGGKNGTVMVAAILTIIAAAGGALTGRVLGPRTAQSAPAAAPVKTAAYAEVEIKELPAVIANLAKPEEMRVRMQVAMVYPKAGVENAALLAARINDDIVAYLKTLTLTDIQGPSGLGALREDLNERAAVRSDGKVREIIIETLVVQ